MPCPEHGFIDVNGFSTNKSRYVNNFPARKTSNPSSSDASLKTKDPETTPQLSLDACLNASKKAASLMAQMAVPS